MNASNMYFKIKVSINSKDTERKNLNFQYICFTIQLYQDLSNRHLIVQSQQWKHRNNVEFCSKLTCSGVAIVNLN